MKIIISGVLISISDIAKCGNQKHNGGAAACLFGVGWVATTKIEHYLSLVAVDPPAKSLTFWV